jgi:hypothetical protein
MLSEVPDEMVLLTAGVEFDADSGREILEARGQFQTVDRLTALVPLVLAAVLLAMVLFARQGSRLRWLGATLVVVAVPVLAVATLLPRWASKWAAVFLPGEILLNRTSLEEVFAWATRPAGSVAGLMLLAGVAAVITSVILDIRRRRASTRMALSSGSLPALDAGST